MAKYDIKYSCGHEGTISLVGPTKERYKKIEWLEAEGLCPECFKKKKREEEKARGLVLEVSINPLDTKSPINLVFAGDSYTYKDQIKALGYYFSEAPIEGLMGFVGGHMHKAWCKTIVPEKIDEELKAISAAGLSPELIKKFNEFDMAALMYNRKAAEEKKKKQDEQIALLEKPQKPEILSGFWNGRIYGRSAPWRIYIDNTECKISEEEKEKILQWQAAAAKYKEEVKKIRNS